jgi:succinate-semialdehyde dehydrogenase/glutarate-semialdehyde dehydrogenase
MSYQTRNPYNGEAGKAFDEINNDQLEAFIATADDCFRSRWRNTGFDDRKKVLKRAATILRERTDDFATLITLEMGKLIAQSRGEVQLCAAILDYYADHGEAFLAPE